MKAIRDRIDNCEKARSESKRAATNKLASVPYRFGEVRYKDGASIIIPSVSSEGRDYIPMKYLNDTVISNAAFAVYDAPEWLFGILTSAMHMAWVRAIGGRLETRYRLLTAVHTADVKQNIGVFPEKLFNDTNNSLRYLFVSRRGCIVQIGQVKPISNIIWICIIIERHGIIYSVICSKDNGSIFIISDIVRCAVIDINNIKFVHRLHPFKIVIPRFCSLFLATLTFCVFRLSLLHPPFLYLSSTLQQSQKVRTRPFLYIICCVHNLILFFFQRQSYE